MLNCFLENISALKDINRVKTADSYSYYRQAVKQAKFENRDSLNNRSKISDIDIIQTDYTVAIVEEFIIADKLFANFKQYFENFVEYRTLNNISNKIKIYSKSKSELFFNLNNTENSSV